ncbi:hypothetical protein NKH59_31445 [Mesorhizobium sp. M0998]
MIRRAGNHLCRREAHRGQFRLQGPAAAGGAGRDLCVASNRKGRPLFELLYAGDGPLKGDYHGGQADYVKKVADSIKVVGVSEGPMTQGLAVPEYVAIKSIAELNDHTDKFPGGIIGIDAGSGLMQAADATVKAYGLKLNLVPGSEAAMEAAFQRAYSKNEPIVVTTWEPLPMWSESKIPEGPGISDEVPHPE